MINTVRHVLTSVEEKGDFMGYEMFCAQDCCGHVLARSTKFLMAVMFWLIVTSLSFQLEVVVDWIEVVNAVC